MRKCQEAIESSVSCGKDICCFDCDQRESCESVCSLTSPEGCGAIIEENGELEVFRSSVLAITQTIANISKQKEKLDAEDKKMREELQKAMEAYGVDNFENEHVKITHIGATTKTSVDSKKLKAELPDIYQKYSKISNVSGYVKITVK